jgi:hypothetical protein
MVLVTATASVECEFGELEEVEVSAVSGEPESLAPLGSCALVDRMDEEDC